MSIILIALLLSSYNKKNEFKFCFIDADRDQAILQIPLDIIILNNSQSPQYLKSDSLGCFDWSTKDTFIHFVVQSPYHKTDTIKRYFDNYSKEDIHLNTDDYNLMLYYYANNNKEDWNKRRAHLDNLISDDALLFKVLPFDLGIEIFSKNDFINKLTTPTQSLNNFEIIESIKQNGKIVKLKFRTKL